MKKYIYNLWNHEKENFSMNDIVIDDRLITKYDRIGWEDTRYVSIYKKKLLHYNFNYFLVLKLDKCLFDVAIPIYLLVIFLLNLFHIIVCFLFLL